MEPRTQSKEISWSRCPEVFRSELGNDSCWKELGHEGNHSYDE